MDRTNESSRLSRIVPIKRAVITLMSIIFDQYFPNMRNIGRNTTVVAASVVLYEVESKIEALVCI